MSWWNVPVTPDEEAASGPFPRTGRVALRSRWERRYSDDQPRDEGGRFGSGGGESATAMTPSAVDASIAGLGAPDYQAGNVTEAQADAHEAYVAPGTAGRINDALDEGRPLGPTDKETVQGMDSLMKPSSEDAIVYRGMVLPADMDLKPGDELTTAGFLSTTSDAATAEAFATAHSTGDFLMPGHDAAQEVQGMFAKEPGTPTTMAIRIPAGTMGTPGDHQLKEAVLARDTTLTVRGTTTDGKLYLEAS